ncbi:hypothetical protein ACWA2B_10320 [Paenibacillus sp. CMM36]
MDKNIASEQLVNKITAIDPALKAAMNDKSTKEIVIKKLSEGFEKIVIHYPNLIDDIQRRIVEYHTNRGRDGKITDFVSLVDWYSMSLLEKPTEWWDSTGEYFNLRMNEVINMFLMARFNFGLV